MWASGLFCEHLLQDHLIERQIGDQLFELAILLLQLSQPPDLGDRHLAILLTPDIVRRFADLERPRDFGNRRPGLHLRSAAPILCLRKFAPS